MIFGKNVLEKGCLETYVSRQPFSGFLGKRFKTKDIFIIINLAKIQDCY